MGIALGIGRGSRMYSDAADWLLRDEFISDLAAGNVNGTAAEPGPGTRTVVDTGNKLTISGGRTVLAAEPTAYGDPGIWLTPAEARIAGKMLIGEMTLTGGRGYCAFDSNTVGVPTDGWYLIGTSAYIVATTPTTLAVGVAFTGSLRLATVLRSTGNFFLASVGSGSWLLYFVAHAGTTTPLYPSIIAHSAAGSALSSSFLRVPSSLWLPTPLASDGFGSAFGTSDGLGHAEGIAGGIGAGGASVTMSNVGATWSVSAGKAINTTPSGLSQQMSVAQMSTANVFASATLTRAAGSVGLALSMDSASSPANGVLVYLEGVNIKVDKCVAGTWSNVSATAYTYSAGARLVVAKNGTSYRTYYNNRVIKVDTIADAGILTGTYHGLFSTDASNMLDDLTIYATGTNGEYAELDKWS